MTALFVTHIAAEAAIMALALYVTERYLLPSVADPKSLKRWAEDNVPTLSSFIAKAHNELHGGPKK